MKNRSAATKPVVGLDVDGTLGDYHSHFLRFAANWLGRTVPTGYDGSVSLAKWCGTSKSTYRQIKLAYRQGGMKRSMPCYEGAREVTVALRKAGAEVVICTTRPYLHLSNIEPDTMHWLKRNGIQYDGLIMGEHKYRQLAREYGAENVVVVFDDLPEQLEIARSLGLPAVLRRNGHNLDSTWTTEVQSLQEVRDIGLASVKAYKEARRNR